jgi:hypothetical protein
MQGLTRRATIAAYTKYTKELSSYVRSTNKHAITEAKVTVPYPTERYMLQLCTSTAPFCAAARCLASPLNTVKPPQRFCESGSAAGNLTQGIAKGPLTSPNIQYMYPYP